MEHDLLVIVDSTYSMQNFSRALQISLPQILRISSLTGCFSRIGLLAYRDYQDFELLEWSGWLSQQGASANTSEDGPNLIGMAADLKASGGGDVPEAIKTALAKAYELMRPEAKTLILVYTDAPPHANFEYSWERSSNNEKELAALSQADSEMYGGYGPLFVDWVSAAKTLAYGEKRAQVFAVLSTGSEPSVLAYYDYLATMTDGVCIHLDYTCPHTISSVTIHSLLSWMGIEAVNTSTESKEESLYAKFSRYISLAGIDDVENEISSHAPRFFHSKDDPSQDTVGNLSSQVMTLSSMKNLMPKKPQPLQSFSIRWFEDPSYRDLASKHLLEIFETDVCAMAVNPVFGSLWRTVCSDKNYAGRDSLANAFSRSIEALGDEDEQAKMKKWLDESYDYTTEIVSTIQDVAAEEQFPCVFLDPTLNFTQSSTDGPVAMDSNCLDESIDNITRGDLLEIGRSCNGNILRRISRILTRLTFVNSPEDMPQHISNIDMERVPRIPTALALDHHKRQFWRILFHLIIPGTRLSARAGALVAALSLKVGLRPLMEVAAEQLICFGDKWNDPSIPENWTMGCLSLLMDADDNYRFHQQRVSSTNDVSRLTTLLEPSDRLRFAKLVQFKILQYNLNAPLSARLPWTPEKSPGPIGPLVRCNECHYPRSVTIMGEGNKCGVCLVSEYSSSQERDIAIHARVSQDLTTTSEATWVECMNKSCRGQYVVYNVADLNVRPKCHYCRNGTQAPLIECEKCHNRMIWPREYREGSQLHGTFTCPPCTAGMNVAADVELTANLLSTENPFKTWLFHDSDSNAKGYFYDKSLFAIVSAIGLEEFYARIELFPARKFPLVHNGKPVLNTEEIIALLKAKVDKRKIAKTECSLCFASFRPNALNSACGRRGCLQRICTDCLAGWYGLNAPGTIINTAALVCPFCRRFPTPQTLAKYGKGIHAVRDLENAIRDKGTMIYAWCSRCCSAKEYMERICAGGAPPILQNWACQDCTTRRGENLQKMQNPKPCPGCGTMSEKISGCGHIHCPIPDCGVHWCYFCGKKSDEKTIYRHMSEQHGGFFDNGMMAEDDYSDDDEIMYDLYD